mgnify:CR=1 FL=1
MRRPAMPWAPHSRAERITAPRLWGSSMPSLSTRKGGSPFSLATFSRSSTVTYSISLAKAATPWWLSVPVIRRSLLGCTRLTVAPASLAMAV